MDALLDETSATGRAWHEHAGKLIYTNKADLEVCSARD